VVKQNENLSQAGIGPVSKTSLPLYVGRWVDSRTGNIR